MSCKSLLTVLRAAILWDAQSVQKESVMGSFGDKVSYGRFKECAARNESDHYEQAQHSLENTSSTKDSVEWESGTRLTSQCI